MQNWKMPCDIEEGTEGLHFSFDPISSIESAVRPSSDEGSQKEELADLCSVTPAAQFCPSSCLQADYLGVFWVVGQRLSIVILGTTKDIFLGI